MSELMERIARARDILQANPVKLEYPMYAYFEGVMYRIDGPDAEPVEVYEAGYESDA